ncbi:MAG: DAK2 domain-containing protein [Oscillospiraceae bacterium]|nr:DAK2 domain-containing protein [Oscillospiraceae bacterium]
MAQSKVDGLLLREMMLAGAALLERNREAVDALNVFPVPDGDTGTNMSLTIMAAVKEMSAQELMRADEAAEALAKGALRGARGNSGVILSQLFRGFARGVLGQASITPTLFAQALQKGAETAYKALMKPKEGTILTVARIIAESAAQQAKKQPDDMEALFQVILSSGENILRRTPEMLPVLKQAGVVDAGGRGLLLIYMGMDAALRGEEVPMAAISTASDGEAAFDDDHDAIGEIKYAYCTEFLIQNLFEQVTEADVSTFRRRLNRIGDCVLVVGDLSLVKVHVHTNDPGKALQAALALGELVNLKIENMVEQRRERQRAQQSREPDKASGMVVVSLGEGFAAIFKDLGVDCIVDGGQTMNPSVENLVSAIDSVHAEHVFVFPNNSNVIFAAQEAAKVARRDAHIIPTKNVAMGVAGVIACQSDLPPEENQRTMTEAAERVKTGMITLAIRDTQYEALTIHEGDCIGLCNGKIAVCAEAPQAVADELMAMLVTDADSLITVFYGEGVSEADAEAMADGFREKYPLCDVEVHGGGQPVYSYILSVE